MNTQLTPAELEQARQLLAASDHPQAGGMQGAVAVLERYEGDVEAGLEELIAAEAGTAVYGEERKTLREAFLQALRREICGDEGFLARVEEYNRNPGQAALLTGAIVYVIDVVTLPINPAIATVVVLWVVKLGIRTFCAYTEGEDPS